MTQSITYFTTKLHPQLHHTDFIAITKPESITFSYVLQHSAVCQIRDMLIRTIHKLFTSKLEPIHTDLLVAATGHVSCSVGVGWEWR